MPSSAPAKKGKKIPHKEDFLELHSGKKPKRGGGSLITSCGNFSEERGLEASCFSLVDAKGTRIGLVADSYGKAQKIKKWTTPASN